MSAECVTGSSGSHLTQHTVFYKGQHIKNRLISTIEQPISSSSLQTGGEL